MPNWIGDAVMATPALNNLRTHFGDAEFVLVGSPLSAEMFCGDPRFCAVVADTTKSHGMRLLALWRLGRHLRSRYGPFDLACSFVNSMSSRILLRATGTPRRVARKRGSRNCLLTDAIPVRRGHDAEQFNSIVNGFLGTEYETGPTALWTERIHRYARPTLGINPGAAYGTAKRWLPARFAETATALAQDFDVLLFGGPADLPVVSEIEATLRSGQIQNVQNVVACSMAELVSRIAGLDLFITNDTGPMHVAGAFGIPTVAVFGSTDPDRTCPWANPHATIVRHALPCAPCQKRTCPLQHHACMTQIPAREVIGAARALVRQCASVRAG